VVLVVATLAGSASYFGLSNDLLLTRDKLSAAENNISSLNQNVASLQNSLQYSESALAKNRTELTDTQSQLTATSNQLTTTSSQLRTAETNLTATNIQLTSAQTSITNMNTQYSQIRANILSRIGYSQANRQSYITPTDTNISVKVKEITGGYDGSTTKIWSDYLKLYNWVYRNIEYSSDTYTPILPSALTSNSIIWKHEFWKMPSETLEDKTGDCEDMALLLTTMMRNYNNQTYRVWTIAISSKTLGVPGHMAVAFPVAGGELTIVDPAGSYYTGKTYGYLSSAPTATAINDWLAWWVSQIPQGYISAVLSDTVDEEFNSTSEFLTWRNQ